MKDNTPPQKTDTKSNIKKISTNKKAMYIKNPESKEVILALSALFGDRYLRMNRYPIVCKTVISNAIGITINLSVGGQEVYGVYGPVGPE